MPLKKFQIPPEQASYAVDDGESVIRTVLDGGKGKYRTDILNATSTVDVTWVFSAIEYEYFRAFFKGTAAAQGATPFLIDLILDEAQALTEHTAYFIPNKTKLTKVRGMSYTVKAQLEVEPKEYTEGYFDFIVYMYETYGENQQGMADMLAQLEQLVNVDLPGEDVFTP